MASKNLPKEILVYQADVIDGEILYAVVRNVEEIPEDSNGQKVGIYTLNSQNTFRVRRELK